MSRLAKIRCSERVCCDQCNSYNSRTLFYARDLQWSLPGSFRISKCSNCGLVYLNPRPSKEEIGNYQSLMWGDLLRKDKGKKTSLEKLRSEPQLTGYISKRAQEIEGYKRGGRILDIGCGTGDFLTLMKEKGWKVAGVEITEEAAGWAREKLGGAVFCGGFEEVHFPDSYFDVVTLYSVLEHLKSPKSCLSEVYKIMKRGGLLVILVPNFGGLQAKLFRKHWYALTAPFHLFQFTPETISRMLGSTGFNVLKFDYFDSVQNPYSFKLSSIFLLKGLLGLDGGRGKGENAQLAKRDSINNNQPLKSLNRRAALFTLDCLSHMAVFVENFIKRGATFTVYAEKRSGV